MLSNQFFAHIENHFKNMLPFVAYSKPNDVIVKALLQKTDELCKTKNLEESGFVCVPFENLENAILIPIENSEAITCELEQKTSKELGHNNIQLSEKDREQHINLVQKGIQTILQQRLHKVVLSRCEAVNFSEDQILITFNRLLQNYPDAFVYCWYHPKVGLWLGATPETLIDITGNRFKTMALAGTQVYKGSLEVEWGQKEIEEQQFVTNYIENCLKPYATNLNISEAKTVKAGNLLHLQSDVVGILNTDVHTVLKKLHPTPAVCGLPVDEAKSFILQNETYHREFYTGFLGELNIKETTSRNTNRRNVENNAYQSVKTVSHLFVNLRCMQIKNREALIYVGGGITKDSDPEQEWEETVSKAETMKRVLLS
jgi:isochorismate synthase